MFRWRAKTTRVESHFSNRTDVAVRDPLTGDPFPGNIIPQSRIDPVGRAIANLYPAPNQAGDLSRAPRNNFVNNASNALTQDFYTGKVDHNFGANDRAYGRFMFSRNPQGIAAVYPNEFADPRAGTRANRHTNVTGSWIHHFTPTLIQDVRVNWGRRLHINRSAGRNSGKNAIFTITNTISISCK